MTDPRGLRRTNETRQALLAQLAHLGDEVDALHRHVDLIPKEVLEGRPLDTDLSFKEIYALLALLDERVYGPAVSQLSSSEYVQIEPPDQEDLLAETAWNELDIREIMDRARSARLALVERLGELPVEAWNGELTRDEETTDVFGLAYGIIQHDAALLQTAAYRLHESRLTAREEGLPK